MIQESKQKLKFSNDFIILLAIIFGLVGLIEFVSGSISLVVYLNNPDLNVISATTHTFNIFPLMQTNGLVVAKSDYLIGFFFIIFANLIYFYPKKLSLILLIFSIGFTEYSFLSWAYFIGCIAPGWECHNLLSEKFIAVFQMRMLTLPFLPLSQDLFALLLLAIVFVLSWNQFGSIPFAGIITMFCVISESVLIYFFDYKEFFLHFEGSIPQLYFLSNWDVLQISLYAIVVLFPLCFVKSAMRENRI